ncbi:Undecaprenyl-phosphate N-acetylglucosaminyl 1-phosphate transferase [hydrothermal vent metagenome]|uniref:Undecaprenyl-phosphate N-acetylglucosaminyl 1-phosphate transferase n=1 Tax=hydrothermal vent metagenome TaxID=652676 RepID=A0A3B0XII9_9ZZZZ
MNTILISALGFPFLILVTYLVKSQAIRSGIVNAPNAIIPQHTKPIAYLGGVAIAINFFILVFVSWFLSNSDLLMGYSNGLSIALFMSLFLILGTYDDLRPLSALKKITVQFVFATLYIYTVPPIVITDIYWLDFSICTFWILLVINAFNFTDVMDGLVGGLSIVLFSLLAIIDTSHSVLYISLAISILAFEIFNAPPASIFLGDAGSHFLGFAAAISTLELVNQHSISGIPMMLLAVCLPLFELFFITSVRIKKGLPWWKGSPDHMALRLQHSGLNKWNTNIIIWILAALSSLACYFLINSSILTQAILTFSVFLLMLLFSRILLRWNVPDKRVTG